MSWETALFCGIHFSRKTYENSFQVESDLSEERAIVEAAKQRLYELAVMTEPSKLLPDDEQSGDYLGIIHDEVRRQLEQIEESTIEVAKLELLLENWDACHGEGGKPITPPKGVSVYKSAYIYGDYIGGEEEDENES